MKKVLIVLLVLAVAGGAFAQNWTFNGLVDGGIGALFLDGEDDGRVGAISKNEGHGGPRAQLDVNFTNEAKNAGLSMRLRTAAAPGSWGTGAFQFRWAYGWVSALDNLIRVEGGRIQGSILDTMDTITNGENIMDNYGVMSYYNLHEYFTVGLGASAGNALAGGLARPALPTTGTPTTAEIAANKSSNFYNGAGIFGFRVNVPDLLRLAAAVRLQNSPKSLTGGSGTYSKAMLSASLLAVKDFSFIVSGVFTQLDEFSDYGHIRLSESIGYNGIENLSLNLAFAEAISQANTQKDLYFRAWFWASYALNNGGIVPRLDFNYVTGGGYGFGYSLSANASFQSNGDYLPSEYSYNKKQSFMTISPSVQFRATNTCWVEIGYLAGIDLSDDGFAGFGVVKGTSNGGINHGIYADVRVSF